MERLRKVSKVFEDILERGYRWVKREEEKDPLCATQMALLQ
jgi:hypothetical protein